MGATALPILAATQAASSAFGQYSAGQAAKRQARAQAQLYNSDAQLTEQQAGDAIARGREAETIARQQTAGLIGTQRAGYAAGGIDVSTGSAQDVQSDSAALGALDRQAIRLNAAREAFGFRAKAYDLRESARLTRQAGANVASNATFAAGTTLLTGGIDTYGAYRRSR